MILFLTIIVGLSALGLITLILSQIWRLRRGAPTEPVNLSLESLVADSTNYFTTHFVIWFEHGAKWLYLHGLLLGQKLLILTQRLFAKIEGRFVKLIHSLRGHQGATTKKGSTSIFLNEIKNFREELGPGRIDL